MKVTMNVDYKDLIEKVKKTINLTQDFGSFFTEIIGTESDDRPWTIRGSLRTTFGSQAGPNGQAWPRLSERYEKEKSKKYPGLGMLIRKYVLFDSLVSSKGPGAVKMLGTKELEYGTSVPYAGFLQDGTKKMPSRPFIGITDEMKEKWKSLIGSYINDSMGGD